MKTYVMAASLALWTTALLAADDYAALDQRAERLDNWQARVDASYATVVSRETSVPEATLEEQRTRTHLGYGSLLIANSLATESGRSFDEIVAQKTEGHGWGAIAQENNVNLGPIVSRMDRADAEFKKGKNKHKHKRHGHRHGKGQGHGKHS